MSPFEIETVRMIRAFAEQPVNYNAGWDIIVEATTDEELCEMFNGDTDEDAEFFSSLFTQEGNYQRQLPATTYQEAIRRVRATVEVLEERRREVESTIW